MYLFIGRIKHCVGTGPCCDAPFQQGLPALPCDQPLEAAGLEAAPPSRSALGPVFALGAPGLPFGPCGPGAPGGHVVPVTPGSAEGPGAGAWPAGRAEGNKGDRKTEWAEVKA